MTLWGRSTGNPDWMKARAVKNRAKGLCGCGRALITTTLCGRCAAGHAERQGDRRIEAKAEEICIYCQARPALPGQGACENCRASRASRYEKLSGSSRCTHCGKPTDGSTRCVACRETHRKGSNRRNAAARAKGICVACKKQNSRPERSTCKACSDRSVRNKRMRRAKLQAAPAPGPGVRK